MLKTGSQQQVSEMFDTLSRGARNIIKEAINLTYFMRGAITYTELMHMTPGERALVSEFLNDRMESESRRAVPIY